MAASTSPPPEAKPVKPSCDCGLALAYLLARLLLGMLLLTAGLDKFKSPTSPYKYSPTYWHDTVNDQGDVVQRGKWWSIASAVYTNGGFDNEEVFTPVGAKTMSHVFRYYALGLPYAMIATGLFILIGFWNRLFIFLGGLVWFSLAAGQMFLPDNPTVLMLSIYTMFHVVAIALAKYNRFALTRF